MSKMIRYERKRLILEELQKSDIAYIGQLSEILGASESTIRRDIDQLASEGRVLALRGGAVRLHGRPTELPASVKSLINHPEKIAIAAAAARQVMDGDTIYLDAGTTALQMMPFLRGVDVHVITSNTLVLAGVTSPSTRLTLLAGEYLPSTGSVVGSLTEDLLRRMHFDKSFVGATGLDEKSGVNTFDVREAMKKRIAHENSQMSFVLLDSTKFHKSSLYEAIPLANCTVVTDRDDELLLRAKGRIIAEPIDHPQDP